MKYIKKLNKFFIYFYEYILSCFQKAIEKEIKKNVYIIVETKKETAFPILLLLRRSKLNNLVFYFKHKFQGLF